MHAPPLRHPGEGRDPAPLPGGKSLDSGLRRNDVSFRHARVAAANKFSALDGLMNDTMPSSRWLPGSSLMLSRASTAPAMAVANPHFISPCPGTSRVRAPAQTPGYMQGGGSRLPFSVTAQPGAGNRRSFSGWQRSPWDHATRPGWRRRARRRAAGNARCCCRVPCSTPRSRGPLRPGRW